jgi:hypothetical protein
MKPVYEKNLCGCPACGDNDNVALVASSGDFIMWCACGSVFMGDLASSGVIQEIRRIHDFVGE